MPLTDWILTSGSPCQGIGTDVGRQASILFA